MIINTPNNPTGAVYTREALEKLGKAAEKDGLYIISDEVYEKLIYGDKEHVSIAALSDYLYGHTIVINGFSKAYSMTGWRIGYSAAAAELTKAMTGLQSHISSNTTSFVQWAAITALTECDAEVENMRKAFEERRDYMHARLCAIPGISCVKPDGAFYLMPDVSSYIGCEYGGQRIEDSGALCGFLLEEAGIAVVPGEAFCMPGTVRIAYSTSMENIEKGMDRMEKALAILG